MVRTPFPGWSAIEWCDSASGAQTERRGGAGPAGGLLGGKDPAGRLVFSALVRGPRCVPTGPFHFLGEGDLLSSSGATSKVRVSLHWVQVPLTRARTLQRQPRRPRSP